MLVELHMLQNFAPSNLNRDDTGSPKDCEFGGYRRARLSSQCQKRAMRQLFDRERLLDPLALGERTKRLRAALGKRLAEMGIEDDEADRIASVAVQALGLKFETKNPDLTNVLVFIGREDIDRLVELCFENQAELLAAALASPEDPELSPAEGSPPRRTRRKDSKNSKVSDDLNRAIEKIWDGRRAVDIALFGRMLADLPDRNRDAAAQVAHALSTNAVSVEFDFFTAVDDLKPASEDAGAGMLGTVEFNSSCYYRYANVDLRQFSDNLGGNEALLRAALRAFLQAAVEAVPSGKQNSFAAHNPPSLVMAVVRDRGCWSLANAFVKPIAPRGEIDLVAGSVTALDDYWGRLTAMYGDTGIALQTVCVDPAYAGRMANLADSQVSSVATLIDRTLEAVALDSRAG